MHELVLHCPEALVETVSEALSDELEALSVSVEDAEEDLVATAADFADPDIGGMCAIFGTSQPIAR